MIPWFEIDESHIVTQLAARPGQSRPDGSLALALGDNLLGQIPDPSRRVLLEHLCAQVRASGLARFVPICLPGPAGLHALTLGLEWFGNHRLRVSFSTASNHDPLHQGWQAWQNGHRAETGGHALICRKCHRIGDALHGWQPLHRAIIERGLLCLSPAEPPALGLCPSCDPLVAAGEASEAPRRSAA